MQKNVSDIKLLFINSGITVILDKFYIRTLKKNIIKR